MDKQQLVKLCSKSWSLKALALLNQGVSGRVSPLASAAGAGRTAMSASVQHLVELGLLERNSGHGHPLRSEFVLTDEGMLLGEWACRLDELLITPEDSKLARATWTLPIMQVLGNYERFNEVAGVLSPITDRSLSLTLTQLTTGKWISRGVEPELQPPLVYYRPSGIGEQISEYLNRAS